MKDLEDKILKQVLSYSKWTAVNGEFEYTVSNLRVRLVKPKDDWFLVIKDELLEAAEPPIYIHSDKLSLLAEQLLKANEFNKAKTYYEQLISILERLSK
jgi:hypothetical protein